MSADANSAKQVATLFLLPPQSTHPYAQHTHLINAHSCLQEIPRHFVGKIEFPKTAEDFPSVEKHAHQKHRMENFISNLIVFLCHQSIKLNTENKKKMARRWDDIENRIALLKILTVHLVNFLWWSIRRTLFEIQLWTSARFKPGTHVVYGYTKVETQRERPNRNARHDDPSIKKKKTCMNPSRKVAIKN